MKYIALLPLILVAACAQPSDETFVYHEDEGAYTPQEEIFEFEQIDTSVEAIPTLPIIEAQEQPETPQQPVNDQPVTTQPQLTTNTTHQPVVAQSQVIAYSTPQSIVPPTQTAVAPTQAVAQPATPTLVPTRAPYIQPAVQTHQTTVQQQTSTRAVMPIQPVPYQYTTKTLPDGNIIIELPAQQIYLPDESYYNRHAMPTQNNNAPISISQPTTVPILLQHREQPGLLAQCQSNDVTCITSFEQQGFVQVRYMPQVAGYKDIPAPSDYPTTGRWRHQNNIPRW